MSDQQKAQRLLDQISRRITASEYDMLLRIAANGVDESRVYRVSNRTGRTWTDRQVFDELCESFRHAIT